MLCYAMTGPSEHYQYWGAASEASGNGGEGALPRENVSRPRP